MQDIIILYYIMFELSTTIMVDPHNSQQDIACQVNSHIVEHSHRSSSKSLLILKLNVEYVVDQTQCTVECVVDPQHTSLSRHCRYRKRTL